MESGFIDFHTLFRRIRNTHAKAYFLDAVKAYKADALREDLASTWVALIYSLIAKHRELSSMGDAAGTAFLNAWKNSTKSGDILTLLQFEGGALDDTTAKTQVVDRIAQFHFELNI